MINIHVLNAMEGSGNDKYSGPIIAGDAAGKIHLLNTITKLENDGRLGSVEIQYLPGMRLETFTFWM
jgi:hypothetical protein